MHWVGYVNDLTNASDRKIFSALQSIEKAINKNTQRDIFKFVYFVS